MPLKGKQIKTWIEWLERQIHPLRLRFWNAQCRRSFACLNLNRSMDLRTPLDHLNTFKTTLGLQQPSDKILFCSFPTTLKGAAKEWFTKLPTSSINSFKQLNSSFLRHFVGGQHPRRPGDHLLTIKQGEKKTLRSYTKHFTWETLEVDEANDKV